MGKAILGAAAIALCFIGVCANVAFAGSKYDKKIETAVIAIVSKKLGDMRGAHTMGETHVLYPPMEMRNSADGTLEPANRDQRRDLFSDLLNS